MIAFRDHSDGQDSQTSVLGSFCFIVALLQKKQYPETESSGGQDEHERAVAESVRESHAVCGDVEGG